MKRFAAVAIFLASLSLILASCPTPFDLDANNLAGKTLSYYGSNGHDVDIFVFDDDGVNGAWERRLYGFDFADEDAETSGDFEDKSWYQNGGGRFDLEYDADTYDIRISQTAIFGRSEDARIAGTYYEEDYSYMDLADFYSLEDGVDYSAYSFERTTKAILNRDNCSVVIQLLMEEEGVSEPLLLFGDNGVDWSIPSTKTTSRTSGGVKTTVADVMEMTGSITENAVSNHFSLTRTQTTGSADPTVIHYQSRGDSVMNGFYLVGGGDPDQDFAKVWKEGNTVSFFFTNETTETICYEGDTPPDEPTSFNEDGYGETVIDDENYYKIDRAPVGISISFKRLKDYVANAFYFDFASRSIE